MDLSEKHCSPCAAGARALPEKQAQELAKDLPGWSISTDGKWLVKKYKFPNFAQTLGFVNQVGQLAEAEQHHPDIQLGWGYAHIQLQTHAAGGLHENDFILAGMIQRIPTERIASERVGPEESQ